MKILQVIGTLDPSYGGPVEGLHNLSLAFYKEGISNEIIVLDSPDPEWRDHAKVPVHFVGSGLGNFHFSPGFVTWLKQNSGNFDAILVNGLFQFQSIGTWLALRNSKVPYFIFTHGALSPWMKTYYPLKHIKKWLYWQLFEYRVLLDSRAVLFTSEDELTSAARTFNLRNTKPIIINSGIASQRGNPEIQRQLFLEKFPSLVGKHLFLFLGRLHPVKGCDLLLKAFAEVARTNPDIHLIVAGPDTDNQQVKLVRLAEQLGINNRITWAGMLKDDLKYGALYCSEILVLPSHSENFGIVIIEALSCRLPVLITNKVNIWREIDQSGSGFVGDDTIQGIRQLINRWLSLSEFEKECMKTAALNCFHSHFEIRRNISNFIQVLQTEISRGVG